MNWFIHLNGFVLCQPGTQVPMPFASKEACQSYLDTHCTSPDLVNEQFELVQSPDADTFLNYVKQNH